jgi:predicted nucleotidyltransferase
MEHKRVGGEEKDYSISRVPEPNDPTGELHRQDLLSQIRGLSELWQSYGLRRVWVFGSIMAPGRFGSGSDVDILVEGAGRRVFHLAAEVERCLGWPVDLLDVEFVRARLLERVQRQGELIYAA